VATSERIVVLLCSLAVIVSWVLVWRRDRYRGRLALLPLSWAIHVAIFTAAAWLKCRGPLDLNTWSRIVRMQGLLMTLAAALYLLTERRNE